MPLFLNRAEPWDRKLAEKRNARVRERERERCRANVWVREIVAVQFCKVLDQGGATVTRRDVRQESESSEDAW